MAARMVSSRSPAAISRYPSMSPTYFSMFSGVMARILMSVTTLDRSSAW